MTKLFLSVLALIVLAGGLLGLNPGGRRDPLVSLISRPEQVLLSRITELAELVTLRVPVSTVITTEIAGYTGSVSCVVVVNGEVSLGVNLEQARIAEVDPDARTVTLVLPVPEVLYSCLDHENTEIYSINRWGLWWLAWGDGTAQKLINRAMREAEATIAVGAHDAHLFNQTRKQAVKVIRSVFNSERWEVTVIWQ